MLFVLFITANTATTTIRRRVLYYSPICSFYHHCRGCGTSPHWLTLVIVVHLGTSCVVTIPRKTWINTFISGRPLLHSLAGGSSTFTRVSFGSVGFQVAALLKGLSSMMKQLPVSGVFYELLTSLCILSVEFSECDNPHLSLLERIWRPYIHKSYDYILFFFPML